MNILSRLQGDARFQRISPWLLVLASVCSAIGFEVVFIGIWTDRDGPGRCRPPGLDMAISHAGIYVWLLSTAALLALHSFLKNYRWLSIALGVGVAFQVIFAASRLLPTISEYHCKELCESGDEVSCMFWGHHAPKNQKAMSARCREGDVTMCVGSVLSGRRPFGLPGSAPGVAEDCQKLSTLPDLITFNAVDDLCPGLPCERFKTPPPRCSQQRPFQ